MNSHDIDCHIKHVHHKQTFNWSNLWQSYKPQKTKIFPKENVFPSTCREAHQLLVELGIEYKKINSCINYFILYIDEYQDKVEFLECKENKYRTNVQCPIVPKKVLSHMPIIPRLQWVFCCKSLSQLMDWHANNRSKDWFMWILADSKALKHIEEKWTRKFKDEPCSIRFGLTIDEVCPFSFMTSNYSVWPVGLIVYNIPPWMSVRKENLMLTLIVPRKHLVIGFLCLKTSL